MLGPRSLVVVLLGLGLAGACGARSELSPGAEAEGEGATGAGATGGSGGSGLGGGGGSGGSGGMGGEGGTPLPECTDPNQTYIYLVTGSLGLYAFKPESSALEFRGTLDCEAPGQTPFSMAVDRTGRAYVVYTDGRLWDVNLLDASCEATPYVPNQFGFNTFGMGYVLDDDELGETLFVADIDYGSGTSKGIATIDSDTLSLAPVGLVDTTFGFRIELTGEGTSLYAFIIDDVSGGYLARVDKQTAAYESVVAVPVGNNIGSWHFAAWGGDFFFFTEESGSGFTTIRRYDVDTAQLSVVLQVPEAVVGAGASTCAPGAP